MDKERWIGLALASLSLLCTTNATAHFRLVQPPSWLNEDSLGGPQKGSPCGPGNTKLILGDDVQPIPFSNTVTTFQAGETIDLHLEETVYHPGYFRVSLAHTKAAQATATDFPNPPLTDTVNCHYDEAAVPTGPHDNVLADGLFVAAGQEGTGRSLMQSVKLPAEPCEDCTLQVVQVMEGHPGSSCFYFHCADIKIVAANVADAAVVPDTSHADDAGAGHVASPVGSGSHDAGTSDASVRDATPDSGGCSVAATPTRGSAALAWCLLTAVAAVLGRWRRRSVPALQQAGGRDTRQN
jgi:Lytic polysaccharide mono-oxygenase, cellulose-degrading